MKEGPHISRVDLSPENVAACIAEYERARPDLGELYTVRLSPFWIDRIPAGIALVRCPVCRARFAGMKAGDSALVAVFSHSAGKMPGAAIVLTYPICQACAVKEAPALAGEIYPRQPEDAA